MVVRRHLPALGVVVTIPSVIVAQLVACGGGSNAHIDSHITLHDSPGGQDTSGVTCTATASYGSPTVDDTMAVDGYDAATAQAGSDAYYINAINADAMPDLIDIELYAGYGSFTSSFKAGTYTLGTAGSDDTLMDCGACITIDTDYHAVGSGGAPTDFYFPTSGTLTLTTLSTTKIAGSLSNVMFEHVMTGSDDQGNPIPVDGVVDSCTSSITSLTFDGTITAAIKADGTQVRHVQIDGIPLHSHLSHRH